MLRSIPSIHQPTSPVGGHAIAAALEQPIAPARLVLDEEVVAYGAALGVTPPAEDTSVAANVVAAATNDGSERAERR